MNSFLLSLVSPVLNTMICGGFKESVSGIITLEDVSKKNFIKLLLLACGDDGQVTEGLEELFELIALADRLQMTAVVLMVEDMLLKKLKTQSCVEMLQLSEGSGLHAIKARCLDMVRDCFDEICKTERFLELSEETLSGLLEEEELYVLWEHDVLEAVLRWMRGNPHGSQEEKLLGKIRYGVFDAEYLLRIGFLHSHEVLNQVIREVMTKKGVECGEAKWDGVERLCENWKLVRKAAVPIVRLPSGTIFGAKDLKDPRTMALNRDGCILVADSQLHQIVVFRSDGSVSRRLGSKGAAPGRFDGPTGVAMDRQGHIVVADEMNNRVQILDANGSVVRCFGSQGNAPGQLWGPCSVAVDREGRIVVAEWQNHRIQVFNADGSVACIFGTRGDTVGQLHGPVSVALDRAGRIVVADFNNNRVQVFSGDGSVELCFGSKGNGPGQFVNPTGVAVDREGQYIVADRGNCRLQVFDSSGRLVRVIGTEGAGVGQFRGPYSVAVDGAGRILVVEWGYNLSHPGQPQRVQVL